jgi:hypothetical protein
MQRQYHNSTAIENSESAPPHPIRRWLPGEPIPKGHDPNPWAALARHAAADEQQQLEEAERDARQRRRAA